jgi:hypothetical protein
LPEGVLECAVQHGGAHVQEGLHGTLVHEYANPLMILRFTKLAESPKVLKILPSGRIRATQSRMADLSRGPFAPKIRLKGGVFYPRRVQP